MLNSEDPKLPLVSCLMVTSDRPEMAKRSIGFYLRQDYPRRQLVILIETDDPDANGIPDYVVSLQRPDIKVLRSAKGRLSLGALRNRTVDAADGEFLCSWDDDDLYHRRRISIQLLRLLKENAVASFLSDQLQWVPRTKSLYWCDWSKAHDRRWPRAIPNTLLCRRDAAPRYAESGRFSMKSEDLMFMYELMRRGHVAVLSNYAVLYVYVTHGSNTWDEEHLLKIPRSTGLGADALRERRHLVEAALGEYGLPGDTVVRAFDGEPVLWASPVADLQTNAAR